MTVYIRLISFLLFIIKSQQLNHHLIQIPFNFDHYTNSIRVSCHLSETANGQIFNIDTKGHQSIAFQNDYYNKDTSRSLSISSFPIITLQIRTTKISGYQSKDTLNINQEFTFSSFSFVYSESLAFGNVDINKFAPYLSLSRSNLSLQDQLYTNGIINRRIIHFSSNKITVGEVDKSIISHGRNIFTCNTISHIDYWGCKMEKLSITNEYPLKLNTYFIFDSTAECIYAPFNTTFYYFKKYYFGDEMFYNSTCETAEVHGQMTIFCNPKIIHSFRDLTIYLSNVAIRLTPSDLFYRTPFAKVIFRIAFKRYTDYWSFDNVMMLSYNIVFDGDNNKLMFFSNRNNMLSYHGNIKRYFMDLIVLMNILGIIFIVMMKRNTKTF